LLLQRALLLWLLLLRLCCCCSYFAAGHCLRCWYGGLTALQPLLLLLLPLQALLLAQLHGALRPAGQHSTDAHMMLMQHLRRWGIA
jgi:hypothetical protein